MRAFENQNKKYINEMLSQKHSKNKIRKLAENFNFAL